MTTTTEVIDDFWAPTLFLIVGVLILQKLEWIANFDQRSGVILHSWFKKKLGPDSPLNREIYSVGTPSGLRKSKVGLRIGGVGFVILGLALIGLRFFWHFQKLNPTRRP